MDSTGRLADTLVAECSRKVVMIMVVEEEADHSDQESNHDYEKVDKTELDDIRSGMEKERCKINYFQVLEKFPSEPRQDGCRLMIELQILIAFSVQDKILHIAKVAEAAKTENLNLSESCRNPSPYETATNYDHHHVQRTSWLQMLELKTQEFRTSPTRSACSLR